MLLRCLIPGDAHFAISIVFYAVVVTIQMVWGDVAQNGNFTSEFVEVIELKTANFNHVDIVGLLGNLSCQRPSDVSCQSHVEPVNDRTRVS